MSRTLAQLVAFYIVGANPRIFTKRWAVRTIVAGRLNSGHVGYHSRQSMHGKGSKAGRRIARMQAEREAREDAAWCGYFDDDVTPSELRTEGRTRHYHDLPIAVNFHE